LEVLVVVAGFSLVQSLFGIGLLVFGTPTLLLLGYPFDETLAALLPASLALSALQLRGGPTPDFAMLKRFATWSLIPLAVVLSLALASGVSADFNLLVAAGLAGFAAVRLSSVVRERAQRLIATSATAWLILTGVIHGLSNLGGAPLMILAASRYQDKAQMRSFVAACYAAFAGVQLAVLALLSPDLFGWPQLANIFVSAIVYIAVGRRFFSWVSAPQFDRLLTTFVAIYAVVLTVRSW
jgi:uncharacterized protein